MESFFFLSWGMCILYVCMCVVYFEVCYGMELCVCCMHRSVQVHAHVEVRAGWYSSPCVTLWLINLKTASLTGPAACSFSQADWPVSSQDSPVPASWCWHCRQVKTTPPPPYVCIRDLSLGPHAFKTMFLPTEPSPWPRHFFKLYHLSQITNSLRIK